MSCSLAAHIAARDTHFAPIILLPVWVNYTLFENYGTSRKKDIFYTVFFLVGFFLGMWKTSLDLSVSELILSITVLCVYSAISVMDDISDLIE